MKKLFLILLSVITLKSNAQNDFEIIIDKEKHSKDTMRILTVFEDKEMGFLEFESGQTILDFKTEEKDIIRGKVEGVYPVFLSEIGKNEQYYFIQKGKNYINYLQDIYNEEHRLIKNSLNDLYKVYETGDLEKMKSASIDNDKILSEYIKDNNNSIVAFYMLGIRILKHGKVNQYVNSALGNFSDEFKKNDKYIFLAETFKKLSSENLFTENTFNLQDIFKRQLVFDVLDLENKKFTLIDFWFSYCGPCIYQFPEYAKLYDEYKSKGFEIIAISTDKTKDISNWKKVINRMNLKWPQYLDENGVEAKKINITVFPTNFLLDNQGKVIQKNIHPEDLAVFLKENLN